jgi:hypothetical protein
METIAGIFDSRRQAERAIQGLHAAGIPNDRIAFLTPGSADEAERVPHTDTEPPGMGKAMGGAVGGAIGAAGGATIGAAAASLLVPGVGPVIAGGIVGAALLGAGGAATGMAAGAALERELADGISHDELYIYEDALRKGRSVVIAYVEDEDSDERVHNVMAQADAESIDAARENWWLGLRDTEEEHYTAQGGDFASDEVSYRRGFEAALNPMRRDVPFTEASRELSDSFPDESAGDAFRQGYARGQAYQQSQREKYKS